MKRPWWMTLALTAVFTSACGGFGTGETEEAVVGSYNLGWSGVVDVTTSSAINAFHVETQLPFTPFAPSGSAAFAHWWGIDNGRTATMHSDGVHYDGSLNSIGTQIYLEGTHYRVRVNACVTTGTTGACTNWVDITVWPQYWVQIDYQDNQFQLHVLDSAQRDIWDVDPVGFTFITGTLPTRAYSPEVMFTLDNASDSYGGCKNDILMYDVNSNHTGHYYVETVIGTGGTADTPIYLSAPSSNAKCSMQVGHYPDLGRDALQWTVSGFQEAPG